MAHTGRSVTFQVSNEWDEDNEKARTTKKKLFQSKATLQVINILLKTSAHYAVKQSKIKFVNKFW